MWLFHCVSECGKSVCHRPAFELECVVCPTDIIALFPGQKGNRENLVKLSMPSFHLAQDGNWAGPGNETRLSVGFAESLQHASTKH